MPDTTLTFAILDSNPDIRNCSICANNPATLKATGRHNGPCCLQCAFSMLADLAHASVDQGNRRIG
jgi:hypothetical protein